jgi:hypothetical protein
MHALPGEMVLPISHRSSSLVKRVRASGLLNKSFPYKFRRTLRKNVLYFMSDSYGRYTRASESQNETQNSYDVLKQQIDSQE